MDITGQATILFIKTPKIDFYTGSLKLPSLLSIGTMASHNLSIETTFDSCYFWLDSTLKLGKNLNELFYRVALPTCKILVLSSRINF
jgi:hypothetical protein